MTETIGLMAASVTTSCMEEGDKTPSMEAPTTIVCMEEQDRTFFMAAPPAATTRYMAEMGMISCLEVMAGTCSSEALAAIVSWAMAGGTRLATKPQPTAFV